MYTAITILIILVCALLVLAVLIQNPKGGGLAVGFSASNQVMGVRKTTDFLEKFTWGLLISLIVFCLSGTIILSTDKSTPQSQAAEKAQSGGAPSPVIPQPGQQPPRPVQPPQNP